MNKNQKNSQSYRFYHKLIAIACCCILLSKTYSQNLIPNYSFEKLEATTANRDKSFSFLGDYKNIQSWKLITPFTYGGFLNACYYTDTAYIKIARKEEQRKNIQLKVYPHSGSAYIRSNCPCNKTLFQTKLKQPLEKGKTYCVEFFYCVYPQHPNSENKSRTKELEIFNTGAFGIHFTNADYSDIKKYKWSLLQDKIQLNPQLIAKIDDTSAYHQWVRFFTTFTPEHDYNYLIIGNHKPMNLKQSFCNTEEWIKHSNPIEKSASILEFCIDDVSVFPLEEYLKMKKLPKGEAIALSNIYFEINSSKLKSSSFHNLDQLANYLARNSKINLEIYGHTDNTGTAELNLKLSKDRANSVKTYIEAKGIPSNRIKTKGFGSSKPIESNETEEGRAKNRRIEIKLI